MFNNVSRDTKILTCLTIPVWLALIFYVGFLNHVSINEIGVAYHSISGEVSIQYNPGWYVTAPTTLVAKLSTRPMRVEIPSYARIIVAKIVRFRAEGVMDFIDRQGWDYSMGQSLNNILLAYAFSGQEYPFLEILQEPKPEDYHAQAP